MMNEHTLALFSFFFWGHIQEKVFNEASFLIKRKKKMRQGFLWNPDSCNELKREELKLKKVPKWSRKYNGHACKGTTENCFL